MDNNVSMTMSESVFKFMLNIVNWGSGLFEWASTPIADEFAFTPFEILGMGGIAVLVTIITLKALQLIKLW